MQILKTAVFSGFLIASALSSSADAQDTLISDAAASIHDNASTGLASNDQDSKNLLKEIERHNTQQDGLIPYSPLQPFRDSFIELGVQKGD